METDSPLLSSIVLAISLATFTAVFLVEMCIAWVRRERVFHLVNQGAPRAEYLDSLYDVPMGPTGALSILRVASFTAALLSSVALVMSLMGVSWPVIAAAALGVVLYTRAVHSAARALSSTYAETIALKAAPPVRVLSWLLHPFLLIQATLTQRILQVTAYREGYPAVGSEAEESDPLAAHGEPLDEREVKMIRAVVELDKTTAREIMVPRVDVVASDINTSISDLAEQMVSGGHSRIPIYDGDLDHIVGIAHARDILNHLVSANGSADTTKLADLLRSALFIPESKTLEELLNEFQQGRVHMAVVIDEYGGVSGLVTIEDLLEEIVGEIQDEFDHGEPEIEVVSNSEFILDARMSIDDLNEFLGVTVEANGFDTLGGFVYDQLGKIPSPGDTVAYDGFVVEVLTTTGRRLKRLKVTRSEASPAVSSYR